MSYVCREVSEEMKLLTQELAYIKAAASARFGRLGQCEVTYRWITAQFGPIGQASKLPGLILGSRDQARRVREKEPGGA